VIERVDGVLDQLAPPFGPHHDAGADLPQLDHIRDLHNTVEQSETGVGQIEYLTRSRQSQVMMHTAGGCRFEIVPTDRSMYQSPDLTTVDARGTDRFLCAFGALLTRQCARRPETPLANAGHQLQPALRQPQPLVKRRKTVLDLLGGYNLLRQRITERFEADVGISHQKPR